MFEQFSERFALGTILLLGAWVWSILTIFNIVMKARSAASAWAWTMAVLALPIPAVPLYWVLGRRTFNGYVEKLRKGREENEKLIHEVVSTLEPYFTELTPVQEEYAGVLEKLSERHFTGGNEICLLIDGEMTFDAIFAAIEKAEDFVLVQFFIVKDDDLGRRLRDLLVRKSKEGVRVYFLYDEIGSYRLSKKYVRSLSDEGVTVTDFHSTQGPSNRFQINFRNHRKIVVVDAKIAFAGGHNVADEYLGKDPKFGNWRDTHVQIVGPAVLGLQIVFLGDWYWATGEVPDLKWDSVTHSEGFSCGCDGEMTVLPLATGPAEALEGGTIFFLNAAARAKKRLWMASPYFVTDESVRAALQLAALRGVDVRIMIPAIPDKWLPWLAAFSFLEEMEAAGVKILRYGNGFLHEKVVLVDDQLASVGTANLDNRSMRLNFEVSIVVLGEVFAQQVASMLEWDFEDCKLATHQDYLDRPWWFRLAVRLARLAAPVL